MLNIDTQTTTGTSAVTQAIPAPSAAIISAPVGTTVAGSIQCSADNGATWQEVASFNKSALSSSVSVDISTSVANGIYRTIILSIVGGGSVNTMLDQAPRIAKSINKRPSTISAMVPLMPSFDASALTATQRTLFTAPGDFDAVALITINIGLATTLDGACIAVTERTDTSKTVPIIGGTSYNVLAAAGTQNGFIPITWSGASSTAVAAGTLARPALLMSDLIPLSSIPRMDGGRFPALIVSEYRNNRTYAAHQFSSAAEADAFGVALAPYELYSTAQTAVDGVSNPAAYTAVWTAGTNTASIRTFGLAFRMRGTAELVLFIGDSIIKGLGAGGDAVTNNAANAAGGWTTKAALALANTSKPVGFINAGIGGQTTAQYLQRAKDWMALLRPTITVYPPYTPNDTPTTDAANSAAFARAMDFADACFAAGTVPVFVAPVPYQGAGTEARRQAFIAKLKTLRGAVVIDPNVAGVYDPANAGGYYWAAGASVDNTHPSASGYAAIANGAAIPTLRAITN